MSNNANSLKVSFNREENKGYVPRAPYRTHVPELMLGAGTGSILKHSILKAFERLRIHNELQFVGMCSISKVWLYMEYSFSLQLCCERSHMKR